MTCPRIVDSGVYVLGALAPGQRLEFERHMASCEECRAEVNDLAVLPGLLGRLDEESVVDTSQLPSMPNVLPGSSRRSAGSGVDAGWPRSRWPSRWPALPWSPDWRCLN